jgi:hypothetical protein
MVKELSYLSLLLLLLTSCEKFYHPAMDTVSGNLVVDAQITNDITRNVVHLSRTRSFYNDQPEIEVTGATVTLNQNGSKTVIKGHENTVGHYIFDEVPVEGKQYFLRIVIGNDVYESKAVTMPSVPKMDNFYTTLVTIKYNENSGESTPRTYEKPGREIDCDLHLTDSLSHYRFVVRNLIEWTWDSIPNSPFPDIYGWYSYQDNESFHLAGPADVTEPGKITKYPLLTLSYRATDYFQASQRTLDPVGWILFIDQFGLSKESYDFHALLNSQFAASGSLFDPIQTQVYGNILCKTNALEIAYGFFDLCTYQRYRYFLTLPTPPFITLRQLYTFPDIPFNGQILQQTPSPESPHPNPIFPPDWWEQ